jgi:F-type H+-transporting ATPase subunit gamma
MKSSRELETKRKGYRSVLGIVNAMKALSSTNIRKGAPALGYCRRYREFMEGSASVVAGLPGVRVFSPEGGRLAVLFGSQFGLCGSLNARVLQAADEEDGFRDGFAGRVYVGRRLYGQLGDEEAAAARWVDAPGSVDGLYETVSEALGLVYGMYEAGAYGELWFVNPAFAAAALEIRQRRVLPPPFSPDERTEGPPLIYMEPPELMEGIIREYVFIELYAAALETVMAENEVRLRSMDFASRNIKKKMQELAVAFNYAHQEEVTDELLEIIAGSEAARAKEKRRGA